MKYLLRPVHSLLLGNTIDNFSAFVSTHFDASSVSDKAHEVDEAFIEMLLLA